VWLHNLSDLLIWMAYVAIPIVLVAYARRRRDLPFRHLYWLFGLFIIGCGFTHLFEVVTYYRPMYRLEGLIKLITALASWGTVAALFRVAPVALSMRMPEDLEREIRARKEAEGELRAARDDLERRVAERTVELTDANTALRNEVAERKRAETTVTVLNARLRRAMAETHHRVKNNLQVISAMVEMQCTGDEETVPVAGLERLSQHISALAAIHDLLTQQAKDDAELEEVSLQAVMNKVLPVLRAMAGSRVLRSTVEELRLPVRQATSLAVVINELVSNALKHSAGDVALSLRVTEDRVQLQVSDAGPGFTEGFDVRTAAHNGLELVEHVTDWDLKGGVAYANRPEGGAQVTVTFPLAPEIVKA
jgi:two-component sensor histidine kinase